MSSNASLPGPDSSNNYRTVFLVDGYAFGYEGNALQSIDYPGLNGSSISKLVYNTNYNALLLSNSNVVDGKIKNVEQIIKDTSAFEDDINVLNSMVIIILQMVQMYVLYI